jgi:hypothetical protein
LILYQSLSNIQAKNQQHPKVRKTKKIQYQSTFFFFLIQFAVTISNKILFPEDPSNYPKVLEKPTRGPAILEKPQNKSLVTIHDKTELESNVQKRTKSKDPKNQVQSPTSKEETSPNDPVKPIQVQRPKKKPCVPIPVCKNRLQLSNTLLPDLPLAGGAAGLPPQIPNSII